MNQVEAKKAEQRQSSGGFDLKKIRQDFPILHQEVNGHPLVYLDNAATTQKPNCVIDAISNYYRRDNANVHRGAHALSDRATVAFENARKTLARFINSESPEQVLWTRGTTEAINLVAFSWARKFLQAGDVILVSWLEHHSNIVPWQLAAQACGASVKPVPVSEDGEIELDALQEMLGPRVKLVAFNHVSNALGTVNPVSEIISLVREKSDALVLIDGAQAVAHYPVDMQVLDCDFYTFSGHKLFGPTGIGVLWGRRELLNAMDPYQGGGEMIERVSFDGTTFNELPYKFEAGTPDIAGAIGLAAAIDYLNTLDRVAIIDHESALLRRSLELGENFPGLVKIGKAKKVAGVFSFLLEGAHPADVGMLLDQQGIAVRTGHHCAQPIMERLNISGTVRASYSIYNTLEEVEQLFVALKKVKQFL